MKKAVVIINTHSGKRKIKQDINKYLEAFKKRDYNVEIFVTKYPNHAKEIVERLENDIDIVISVGGDGTFNEVVTGNLKRKKRLILSHLPYGTTNDIGRMFSMGKNMLRNLLSILDGQIQKIDICTINKQPFVYVAGFGKFMNIPYETPRKLKKNLGYFAYLASAIHDFFHVETKPYHITYEVNGKTYQGKYSFALISNANRIAGINNFYKDVKLDDHKFEVLFCDITRKKDIVKSLVGLKIADITKVPGFYFYKTDHLKITFHEHLKKSWCFDGEEYSSKEKNFLVEVIPDIEVMLPNTVSKELFTNGK